MVQAVAYFNERFRTRAEPLTLERLTRQPAGRIEQPGGEWLIAYSLFEREGRRLLGIFSSHPRTNSFYVELDADGAVSHSWSSWETSVDGHETHNRSGLDRARAAGIPM